MASLFAGSLIVTILFVVLQYLKVLYECCRNVKVFTKVTNKEGNKVNKKRCNANKVYKQAPGPLPWPILGNLLLLAQYEVPFDGFSQLAKKFGDVYSLTLGSTRCLIVNNLDLIREVLNKNGKSFGGRPDFIRYNWLFGGDRNNSLALCDWSQLQQKRRNLARKYCSPRNASNFFAKMSDVGCFEMAEFMGELGRVVVPGQDFHMKPLIMQACANMFSQYMCSIRFNYDDTDFRLIVHYFDEIFWEINQGYAVDFLPWLAPVYLAHKKKLTLWATTIRRFILERIVTEREKHLNEDEQERDFTDALLKNLTDDPNVTRDTIIFMLEDFLGGHSAIGNLIMLALAFIVRNPEIGREIQQEIDRITNNGRAVTLHDTESMPYTVATIYEVLRYASSPIVPHVATEDTCISSYGVTKGTIVFINNYELNTSDRNWNEPYKFDPTRFLEKVQIEQIKYEQSAMQDPENEFEHDFRSKAASDEDGCVVRVQKNIPYFLPFSIGKRTCIGQNLVRGFGFIILANILQVYDVGNNNLEQIRTYPACVALPPETFQLNLQLRKQK